MGLDSPSPSTGVTPVLGAAEPQTLMITSYVPGRGESRIPKTDPI